MYPHLVLVLATLLWLPFHPFTTTALDVARYGPIATASNQTQGKSNLKLTPSAGFPNKTLAPSRNFISYHVPHSPTTLQFHGFGSSIPVDELLQTVALAVGVIFKYLNKGEGRTPIATGVFVFTHEFRNHDELEIIVGDFREIGRPMTYNALFDVVRGVGEFMIVPGHKTQEVEFEAEIQGLGYVGTGHVDYKPAEVSTSRVA